jgi:DNA-binding NtrC family response regulator
MPSAAIVCVDDEALIVLCMKRDLLAHYGDRFVYESATSAEEALVAIDELLADGMRLAVLITDWLMPGTKGDQLIAEVRKRCSDTAAILVSGQVEDETVSRLREDSAPFSFIEKPCRPLRLFAEIDACVPGH